VGEYGGGGDEQMAIFERTAVDALLVTNKWRSNRHIISITRAAGIERIRRVVTEDVARRGKRGGNGVTARAYGMVGQTRARAPLSRCGVCL